MNAFAFVPVVRGANRLEVKAATDNSPAELILIGAVGKSYWDDSGITEQEVRDALKTIPKGKPVNIRINSEGGSVKEGLGIYNAFKERSADLTAHVTGYALSIASVFPLGAGKVVSPKSAIWMIHQAWAWNQGNADQMRQAAEMLDAHDETLISIYAAETGKSKAEIRSAMEKETWIKGEDAVTFGLADETDTESDDATAAYRPIDPTYLSRCKNLSPEILNALRPANSGRAALDSAVRNGGQQPNPTKDTMNKKIIVALLTKHGIEASETETDEQLQAKLEKLPTAAAPAAAKPDNDLAAVRAELQAIKVARISDRVNAFVDSQKITKAEAKLYIAQALTSSEAESEVFALLAEKAAVETVDPAGAHIEIVEAAGPVINKNGVQGTKILPELDNIFATHKTPEARWDAMKAEFPRLLKAGFSRDRGVQAANTFSSTVTTNFLIMGAIQKLSGRFAAAKLFARDAEQDPYKPLAAGIRKFNSTATDGSQVQTNPTDFEGLGAGGDSTIDAITITPAQYVSGGHITNSQLNSGFRVGDIVEKKLIDLAAKVTQVLTAPITVANFTTNAALVSAPAAFGLSDLATLQGQLKKTSVKNLILDGEYIARVANVPGFYQMAGTVGGAANGNTGAWKAFGWDNIALNTDWSGAGANVRGFACGQDAIGFISGLPMNPPEGIPGNIVQTGVAMLPDVDLGVATYAWFSPSARTFYFTFDMILGASLVDELQGVLVKSA